MPRKEQPKKKESPHRRSVNAAKARRQQRERTQRSQDIRNLDMSKIQEALSQFGEGLKVKIAQRQQMQIARAFSAPVEDQAVHSFSVPAPLTKPSAKTEHGDRTQWFWRIDDVSVVASLIMTDSAYLDREPGRHGSHAGDWVVDVLGRDGGACFQMTSDKAKEVGESILSAVYWQYAWRSYEETKEPENNSADVIQFEEKPRMIRDEPQA